jgi:putative membrane protein
MRFEIQTRLAFLGMLLGTIPLFFAEVKRKERLKKKHYIIMVPSFFIGILFLFLGDAANDAESINTFVAFILGFFGVALTIIPGLNWATLFSAVGLYGHWLTLMSFRPENLSLAVYLPAFTGAFIGLFAVSKAINFLFRTAYTATLSALFGFFIAVVPSIILDADMDLTLIKPGPPVYTGLFFCIAGIFIAYGYGLLNRPADTP